MPREISPPEKKELVGDQNLRLAGAAAAAASIPPSLPARARGRFLTTTVARIPI